MTNTKFISINYDKYTYKIDINSVKQSNVLRQNKDYKPVTVKSGSNNAVIFVVKYLNYYSNHTEINPPEHPLSDNTNLHDLFEREAHIFGDLLDIDIQMQYLKDILSVAEELGVESLVQKISAILCFFMMKLS